MFTDILPGIVFDTDTIARIRLHPHAITISYKDGGITPIIINDDVERQSKFNALSDILLGRNKTKSNISGIEFVDIPYTKPFQLSKTVITQRQWHDVMKTKPWAGEPCVVKLVMNDDDCPATYVSWYDATEFCKRHSTNGKTYRLPTETEWEFACRGGSTADYHFGNDEKDIDKYAWFLDNCKNESYAHRVAQKLPNQYGLYDMHGNVWEWCQDSVGSSRVLRGGSWRSEPFFVRCAYRNYTTPGSRNYNFGFRLVLE